jgi:hypothetical protein
MALLKTNPSRCFPLNAAESQCGIGHGGSPFAGRLRVRNTAACSKAYGLVRIKIGDAHHIRAGVHMIGGRFWEHFVTPVVGNGFPINLPTST